MVCLNYDNLASSLGLAALCESHAIPTRFLDRPRAPNDFSSNSLRRFVDRNDKRTATVLAHSTVLPLGGHAALTVVPRNRAACSGNL